MISFAGVDLSKVTGGNGDAGNGHLEKGFLTQKRLNSTLRETGGQAGELSARQGIWGLPQTLLRV